jgi:hypothetical protein
MGELFLATVIFLQNPFPLRQQSIPIDRGGFKIKLPFTISKGLFVDYLS